MLFAEVTNPGVWIILFVVCLSGTIMGLFGYFEQRDKNRRQEEEWSIKDYDAQTNGYMYDFPNDLEARQRDDGSYMCTQCRDDWYSCDCPRIQSE